MHDTTLVIPCYNEVARLLPNEFLSYVCHNETVHFLFVNDCSTDDTGRLLDELCRQRPGQLQALHLPRNLGKAGAVRAGFLQAFSDGCKVVGFWDADLATPLVEIKPFRDLLANGCCQMVFGSRVRLLGRHIERRMARHYLGRIFASLASLLLGLTIYDSQCGAKLFVNTKELRQVFAKEFTVNWIFDVELLGRYLLLNKYQGAAPLAEIACEYPLHQWKDMPGSKLKAKDFAIAIVEMVMIWSQLRGGWLAAWFGHR